MVCWTMGFGVKVCLFEPTTGLRLSNHIYEADDKSADDSKRWSMGRGASAKLREGFGFRRSLSTQGV